MQEKLNRELAPGLLTVLQQAVALRLGFIVLALALQLIVLRGVGTAVLTGMAVEGAFLLGAVVWTPLRIRLGVRFLPAVLAWSLIVPAIERVLVLSTVTLDSPVASQAVGAQSGGLVLIWLAIPAVLAAWQYGRPGLHIALALLIGEQAAIGLFLGRDASVLSGYALNTGGQLVMIGLIGYVVVRLVEAERRRHGELQAAHVQLARRAATIEQLAASRERNRLSRALHDTLAHSLTGLSVQLQALETLMRHDPAAAQSQLKEAQATVRGGVREVRRAIAALRATPVEDLGLPEALRRLCQALAERLEVRARCEIGDIPALDPLTEQAIYRIAEAALANVEQHAGATEFTVRLLQERSRIVLVVRDDGVGFDPESLPPGRFGLTGMGERAELIGGTLHIISRPGTGAEVRLEAPIS